MLITAHLVPPPRFMIFRTFSSRAPAMPATYICEWTQDTFAHRILISQADNGWV